MSPPLCIGRRGQKYDKSVYYQSKALAKVHDIATKLCPWQDANLPMSGHKVHSQVANI